MPRVMLFVVLHPNVAHVGQKCAARQRQHTQESKLRRPQLLISWTACKVKQHEVSNSSSVFGLGRLKYGSLHEPDQKV